MITRPMLGAMFGAFGSGELWEPSFHACQCDFFMATDTRIPRLLGLSRTHKVSRVGATMPASKSATGDSDQLRPCWPAS
jgi:hypothetical protein